MKIIFLVLLMIAIAASSLRQVQRDPRFTRRVVLIHIVALTLYLVYCLAGTAVFAWMAKEYANTDSQIALSVTAIALWIIFGCIIMARFLKKFL